MCMTYITLLIVECNIINLEVNATKYIKKIIIKKSNLKQNKNIYATRTKMQQGH